MTDYANGSTPRILLRAYLTSDHISDATGKTIAVTISKNGGAFANPAAGATNATEIANGWYYVTLGAGDTDTNGPLIVRGTAASTDTAEVAHDVVPATNGRLSALPAAAAEAAGGLYTRGTGAGQINQDGNGRIDANVKTWIGGTIPAVTTTGVPLVDTKYVTGTLQTAGDLAALINAVDDYVDTEVAAIKAKTDQLTFTNANKIDATVLTIAANAITAASMNADASAEIADAVWEEALSDHSGTVGSTAAALNAAGSAGDPWNTALPGAYGAGTAGKIIGDNIDATISSRASQTSANTIAGYIDTEVAAILAAVDTEVAAIKAKTDLIPAAPAAVADIPTAIENADALLNRNMATGTDSGGRTVRNALRFLRNKWSISGTTLTVTKEDDSTSAWTASVSTDASADPITGNDPA